jgi:murein DD-endopeptidase MepM/ murein hydrolase activator NlpD
MVERFTKRKMWTGEFELPTIVQRYSTPYGEIRTTPERGRYLHRAVDIVNHPKSVIWASQHGKVIIKDRYLHSGNTIVLDHGCGVFTLYYHLEDFADLEVGDAVKKGNPVGRLGMTGYATGYHLHWELRVGGMAVDPLEWTKKSFM